MYRLIKFFCLIFKIFKVHTLLAMCLHATTSAKKSALKHVQIILPVLRVFFNPTSKGAHMLYTRHCILRKRRVNQADYIFQRASSNESQACIPNTKGRGSKGRRRKGSCFTFNPNFNFYLTFSFFLSSERSSYVKNSRKQKMLHRR